MREKSLRLSQGRASGKENFRRDELCRKRFWRKIRVLFSSGKHFIPKKERLSLLDQAFATELQPYLLNFLKLLLEKGLVRGFKESYKTYKTHYIRRIRVLQKLWSPIAVPLQRGTKVGFKSKSCKSTYKNSLFFLKKSI